jgi:hypothetical protein
MNIGGFSCGHLSGGNNKNFSMNGSLDSNGLIGSRSSESQNEIKSDSIIMGRNMLNETSQNNYSVEGNGVSLIESDISEKNRYGGGGINEDEQYSYSVAETEMSLIDSDISESQSDSRDDWFHPEEDNWRVVVTGDKGIPITFDHSDFSKKVGRRIEAYSYSGNHDFKKQIDNCVKRNIRIYNKNRQGHESSIKELIQHITSVLSELPSGGVTEKNVEKWKDELIKCLGPENMERCNVLPLDLVKVNEMGDTKNGKLVLDVHTYEDRVIERGRRALWFNNFEGISLEEMQYIKSLRDAIGTPNILRKKMMNESGDGI